MNRRDALVATMTFVDGANNGAKSDRRVIEIGMLACDLAVLL